MSSARLLIADQASEDTMSFSATLRQRGYQIETTTTPQSLLELLKRQQYQCLLMGLAWREQLNPNDWEKLSRSAPGCRMIIFTQHENQEAAVRCLREGAHALLSLTMQEQRILDELDYQISQAEKIQREDLLNQQLEIALIGTSQATRELREVIKQIKDVDSTVLILGESGTGKEVVARAIHSCSRRSEGQFAAINCGAIPEALLESELFGHERGAFTDAIAERQGIFSVCDTGTLLLDEIGDMPFNLQRKLLRVLQEKMITPVGSNRSIQINTRVIAATHRDIAADVVAHRFREDLYYRLSVVLVNIAPLRQRREDIPLLIEHFLQELNQRFGKQIQFPGQDLLERLKSYPWPGNVRELRNALERGVIFSDRGQLNYQHLFPKSGELPLRSPAICDWQGKALTMQLTQAKQYFECNYLHSLLKRTHGNISEVARRSGRYRADVYRLIDRYGLKQESYRSS